jgi:hypothetical protein
VNPVPRNLLYRLTALWTTDRIHAGIGLGDRTGKRHEQAGIKVAMGIGNNAYEHASIIGAGRRWLSCSP